MLGKTQQEGAKIIAKACGVSEQAVYQWQTNETLPFSHVRVIEQLCVEATGNRPFEVLLRASTSKVKVNVSTRNMALRIMTLAGRIATDSLVYAGTRCARARERLRTSLGKLTFKIHKMQAGL
jgi:hypothetical protein